jgi:hypothetical protein
MRMNAFSATPTRNGYSRSFNAGSRIGPDSAPVAGAITHGSVAVEAACINSARCVGS